MGTTMDQATVSIVVALIGVVATFGGALAYIVRRQTVHIERALKALTDAVEAFRRFECEERTSHERMVVADAATGARMKELADRQVQILEVQKTILEVLERILQRLPPAV